MKKFVVAGIVAVVSVLAVTGAALAHNPGDGEGGRGPRGPRDPEVFAEALGITVDELEAALEAGTTPQELIEQYGLDETVLQAAREARIQEKVENGDLTQEEADAILSGERPFGRRGPRPGGDVVPQVSTDLAS